MLIPGYLLVKLFALCEGNALDQGVKWLIPCYVVGLLWHKLMELVFRPLRNNELGLALGRAIAYGETSDRGKTIETKPTIREKYYEAYYRLGNSKQLGAVPVVEQQIALLQNLMFILPFMLVKYNCVNTLLDIKYLCLVAIPSLIVVVAMFCSYFSAFQWNDFKRCCCFELFKWLGFVVFALCMLCVISQNVELPQGWSDCLCWAVIKVFLLLLVVYKLLQIKVYSMVWEADAYYTDKKGTGNPLKEERFEV